MIYETGLLNDFVSPIQTRSTFVIVRWRLPASYYCIMVPGAYWELYRVYFWPPGDVVHAAQSIMPALRSVNLTIKQLLSVFLFLRN